MSNCTYCTLFFAVDYKANKRNIHCNLKQTVPQSYFLWKLVLNVFSALPVCLSSKHTPLYALFLKVMAEERAFHADFSPTIQSLKTICESWGVQQDKKQMSTV